MDDTFDLSWRRQVGDGDSEEEVMLYWNSTATLREMGMPCEPERCYLLLKKKKDGTQPQRVQVEKKVSCFNNIRLIHFISFHCQVTKQTSSSIPATSGAADVNILNNTNTAINSTVSSYRSSSNMPSSSCKYNTKSDTGEDW